MTNRKLSALFVALVVTLAGGVAVTAAGANMGQSDVVAQVDDTETATVTFDDQDSDGNTVTVDSASLPDGGFVTIHDSTLLDGDAIGSVVGTSEYLEPGDHEDVTVELDESIDGTQTLIAMPHMDTNENQQYDFVTSEGLDDTPYLADGGAVTDDASVTVTDSETADESFTVTELQAPADANAGETLIVHATVENPNDDAATQNVEFRFNGDVLYRTQLSLDGGASETVAFDVDTTDVAPGTYVHGVFTRDSGEIAEINVSDEQSFALTELNAPENATAGDTIDVSAVVENPNDEESTQQVEFRLGGSLVESQNVTLAAGETENVTFEVDTTGLDPGSYYHGVFTRDSGEIAQIEVVEPEPEEPEENASVTFDDQTSNGDSVMVANASNADAPFYVAVWTVEETTDPETGDETQAPETLLGFTLVNDTAVDNVSVLFSEANVDESQTLVAAVHPDQDGDASTTDPDTETILASDSANVTVEAATETATDAGTATETTDTVTAVPGTVTATPGTETATDEPETDTATETATDGVTDTETDTETGTPTVTEA